MSTTTTLATTRLTTKTWKLFAPGVTTIANERVEEPLRWRKPQRVGINGDLFHEAIPDEFIDRVFAVMALSKPHAFQVLTKRPERMREYLNGLGADTPEFSTRWDVARRWLRSVLSSPQDRKTMGRWEYVGVMMAYQRFPLPNVWLGVSVEDQERADQRIPVLLDTPAAVRFVSAEPLLGPVDLMRISTGAMTETDALLGWLTTYHDYKPAPGQPPMGSENCEAKSNPEHRISWVIVGGESGPGARPCDLEWIRSIVRQCQAAGVAVFYKQGGYHNRCSHDRKGGHFECFPDDLKVREFPNAIR